jgi:hypothetical protein
MHDQQIEAVARKSQRRAFTETEDLGAVSAQSVKD